MLARPLALFAGLVLLLTTQRGISQPPVPAEKLQARAELIVTGQIQSHREEDVNTTRFVFLTVKVESVEKGEAVKPGDTLQARCWVALKRDGKTDPGHASIPGDAGRARFFLILREGGWRVIIPNGAELLDATPPLRFPIQLPDPPPDLPANSPPLFRWLPWFLLGGGFLVDRAEKRAEKRSPRSSWA